HDRPGPHDPARRDLDGGQHPLAGRRALAVAAPAGLRDRGVRGAALRLARQEGEPRAVLLRGRAGAAAGGAGGRLGQAGADAWACRGEDRPLTPALSPEGRGSGEAEALSRGRCTSGETRNPSRRGEGRRTAYFEGV